MGLTPEQKIVIALAAFGGLCLALVAGDMLMDEFFPYSDEEAYAVLIGLGLASCIGAMVVAKVFKLRK